MIHNSPMSISSLLLSPEDKDQMCDTDAPSDCFHERLSFSSESTVEDQPTHHCNKQQQDTFIHRVSNIPLVHSAMKAYENSKNSSPVVKYGAEKVESFVIPIYDKFGKQTLLSGVDAWGCKQLDKLEKRYPNYISSHETSTSMLRKRRDSREEIHIGSRKIVSGKRFAITKPPNRSRQTQLYQGVLAVVSEEGLKCLKYCIHWLQYASHNIKQQISLLLSFSESPTSILQGVKKEIVNTLRKVVSVVSKFSGTTLAEHDKDKIRDCLLSLPSKWDSMNAQDMTTRLLQFANECIEIINSVVNIFQKTEQQETYSSS